MIPAVQEFNADLYVTAATIIPVLFIALLFPGGILNRYALWAKRWRSRGAVSAFRAGDTRRMQRFLNGYTVLILPVDLAIVFAVWGEISAFIALNDRKASPLAHTWVLSSVVILVVVSALSALVSISVDPHNRRRP